MRLTLFAFLLCSSAHAQLNTNILHDDEIQNGRVSIDTLHYESPQDQVPGRETAPRAAAWKGFDGNSSGSVGGSFNAAGGQVPSGSAPAGFATQSAPTDAQKAAEAAAAAQAAQQAALAAAQGRIAAANNQASVQSALEDANRRAAAAFLQAQQQSAAVQQQQNLAQQPGYSQGQYYGRSPSSVGGYAYSNNPNQYPYSAAPAGTVSQVNQQAYQNYNTQQQQAGYLGIPQPAQTVNQGVPQPTQTVNQVIQTNNQNIINSIQIAIPH